MEVRIDNASDADHTVVSVVASNRPGLLGRIADVLHGMGLDICKADVESLDSGVVADKFFVQDRGGGKLPSEEDVRNTREYLQSVLSEPDQGAPQRLRPFTAAALASGEELEGDRKRHLLNSLMDTYLKNDVLSIEQSIINHVEFTLARSRYKFDDNEAYYATAYSLRDRLIESWNDTQALFREVDPKRVYYLSMEFLQGRSLTNATMNLGVADPYSQALQELGYDLETLQEEERDAALGNGGLGRLASCFLDSMATENLPAWGYGIRYQYGMFAQRIVDGFQHEVPDYWLNFANPWEIPRPNLTYPVKFYGHVSTKTVDGKQMFQWNAAEEVAAVAYDNPIPGFGTSNTINLRLWSAKPSKEFDLEAFNTGDYVKSILNKQRAETISSVLYPDDRTYEGKELRLKQQHFFVSATLQDIVRRYKESHSNFDDFADKVALQLNDTHPTIGVPELMRILMDENALGWTRSWEICQEVFSFTNHTVLPEALESWPVTLVESLLPRHMQIIYDINWRFLQDMQARVGEDWDLLGRMSIIEETPSGKNVRMAYLALVASHTVNGVAAIHSRLIKETIFKEFHNVWPEKFQNKTNGVTQRRWLAFCNPGLRALLTEELGTEEWISDMTLLESLKDRAEDPDFQAKWREVKAENKLRLKKKILEITGEEVRADALYDIQVKRIHEYKRQILNVLGVIHRYAELKEMSPEERAEQVPRVCVIGGKAAPGYDLAKRVIKLISAVGDVVNNDPDLGGLLKLIFLPDYNVSLAEVIVPGSELSQHISTAGTEASGTSNMKFAMNGCLILGTMDGANIEIAEEIGEENMFIFGMETDEIEGARAARGTTSGPAIDPRFAAAIDQIRAGTFGWADYFSPLCDSISPSQDFYCVSDDFASYVDAQERVDKAYKDQASWTKMSILSCAGSSKFSSDRTIREYAEEIWGVQPITRDAAGPNDSNAAR